MPLRRLIAPLPSASRLRGTPVPHQPPAPNPSGVRLSRAHRLGRQRAGRAGGPVVVDAAAPAPRAVVVEVYAGPAGVGCDVRPAIPHDRPGHDDGAAVRAGAVRRHPGPLRLPPRPGDREDFGPLAAGAFGRGVRPRWQAPGGRSSASRGRGRRLKTWAGVFPQARFRDRRDGPGPAAGGGPSATKRRTCWCLDRPDLLHLSGAPQRAMVEWVGPAAT